MILFQLRYLYNFNNFNFLFLCWWCGRLLGVKGGPQNKEYPPIPLIFQLIFFPSSMNASTGLILTINIKVIFFKKSFSTMVDELDHMYFLSLLFVNLRIQCSLCTMLLVMKIKHK